MIGRLLVSVGLFALGYYLGRELERQAPARRALEQGRRDGVSEEIRDESPRNAGPHSRDSLH